MVPEPLVIDVHRVLGGICVVGGLEQLVLAELLDFGGYDGHVRTMRTTYRLRRDGLVAMLAEADCTQLPGIAAGLHALIEELPRGTEAATVSRAAARRLALFGLDTFRHPAVPKDRDALIVGFGTPSPSGWPGALNALSRVGFYSTGSRRNKRISRWLARSAYVS